MTDKLKCKFPEGFLWGTATSSHQIEGNNENNWSKWEKKGNIQDKSISGRACNSWELFAEDIKLCKELNNNTYRFGIEWSRIESKKGKFDKEALEHYKKIIKECCKNNIEPFVTLYHWTQPIWFRDLGGWENKNSPLFFKRYVEYVAKHIGSDVKFWCTINEPMIYSFNSYLKGKWPPQKKNYFKFRKVLSNLIKAHKLAYFSLHEANSKCKVSIAKNNQFFEPYINSFLNKIMVRSIKNYWNHFFLRKIENEIDYIGLNYYFHNLIFFSARGYIIMNENKLVNDMGWEIYPRGIYEVLKELKEYNKPIYILENGLADSKDEKRSDFIINHLQYIHQAIQEDINIRGYFHWSLLDNFEWSEGYEPKFGLYKVNFKTFKRKARPSAKVYSEICKNNGF